MKNTAPHYLLLTEAQVQTNADPNDDQIDCDGRWRFVLEEMAGDDRVEVSEREPNVWGERLELLAIVRGLEALEQPSRVTLITASKYAGRRIRSGFSDWKDNQWCWECFGEMKPVKHSDLWKRIDAAMQYHRVECRIWQWTRPLAHRLDQKVDDQGVVDQEAESPLVESVSELGADRKIIFKRRHNGPRIEVSDFDEIADSRASVSTASSASKVFDDRDFFRSKRATLARVVEIDPDRSQPVSFPQAFGCTIN